MKNKREDNTVSVVQRAIKHFGVKVTTNSVKVTLKSNTYYPTLKSICDALSEWKIEHYPLKYEPDEIKGLKSPYLTHFNSGGGQIAFVTSHESDCVVLYDSFKTKKRIGWDEYLNKISGAIILLNPDENSGEINYRQKSQEELLSKFILPATLGVVALVIFSLLINKIFVSEHIIPWQQNCLLFTKLAGILFSALLIMKEYEINMPLAEKLCHISKSFNCNSALNDKAAMVFGSISWAEVGMVYFTGSLMILLQTVSQHWNGFLIVASALSLPYTVFSIWYQGFILKKWCPFCIMVQVILVAEFFILLSFLRFASFSFNLFTAFILIFLAVGVLQVLVNLYLRVESSARYNFSKLQEFKKHPEILHTLLISQKHYDTQITDKCLLFGQKNQSFCITAFLGLHCSHCAEAFIKIKEILKLEIEVQINLVLTDAESKILDTLYSSLKNGKEDEALTILDKWYKSDHLSRIRFPDDFCIVETDEVSQEINTENYNLIKLCEVTGTPTFFINGYRLPSQYDIDDIKYFSEIFIKTNF